MTAHSSVKVNLKPQEMSSMHIFHAPGHLLPEALVVACHVLRGKVLHYKYNSGGQRRRIRLWFVPEGTLRVCFNDSDS